VRELAFFGAADFKTLIYALRVDRLIACEACPMLAITDICRIVESGFPGFTCNCISTQGLLQIKVSEPASGDIKLQLNGVSPEHLVTIRDISNFIGELRTEISAGRRAFAG
jgi:hypothetical protein